MNALRELLAEVVAKGRTSMLPYCSCRRLATRKKRKPKPDERGVVAWFFCDDHGRAGVQEHEYEPVGTADLARRVRSALEDT